MTEKQRTPRRMKRRKKLRVGRVLFTVFFFGLIGVATFVWLEFQKGETLMNRLTTEPIAADEFEGDLMDPAEPAVENFLLLGVDLEDEEDERNRTDTMMLVSWDKQNKKVKLVSFMRDIYTEIPGYQSYKLNTAYYLEGVQGIKETITTKFGVPIHHYALIDFENFKTLLDMAFPDGLLVDVEKTMSENLYMTLHEGERYLDGKEMLAYARFRADNEGDFGRVRRQQQLIKTIRDEALKPEVWPRMPRVIGAATELVQTDMDSKEELMHAFNFMRQRPEMESLTIPVEGSYVYADYEHAGNVLEIDFEQNIRALHEFLGE